ncbi:hypothetical protein NAI33_10815, partial [Francisella tularensis subsp. holarctica]|nr:hypothetical protein [Francisella tularensis subsp. holarctica]
ITYPRYNYCCYIIVEYIYENIWFYKIGKVDIKRDLLKISILACLITLLFSCATRQTYIDQQKAWIGKSIDGYMQEFGMPQNV